MSRSNQRRLRCAIYTRKSSKEGLDQAFNSLDAQHEACSAFIVSQASLGWKMLPDRYDDGGVSGGTMERPALTRLLQHIRDGLVDVVVVYKIDRLTRSLTDFAKIVEVFEKHDVSFVSVTQQFNTTSSMGRLTLNVLLSFAQFEREVAAERIRDKVAASRRKGMWMGGTVPLGYRVVDKALVIVTDGAEAVRSIFRRYLELRSVQALARELDADTAFLDRIGRASIRRGPLYHLLSNVTYIGKVRHRDNVYDGQHDAIIGIETFEEAQALLKEQAPARSSDTNVEGLHLLTGLLFDETGDRLCPTFCNRRGKRYRYYISNRLKEKGTDPTGWRLPAHRVEAMVEQAFLDLLRDRRQLLDWIDEADDAVGGQEAYLAAADRLAAAWPTQAPGEKSELLKHNLVRIDLRRDALQLHVDVEALLKRLSKGDEPSPGKTTDTTPQRVARVTIPLTIRRRGQEARIVVEASASQVAKPDDRLVALIGRAHLYLEILTDGSGQTLASLARQTGVHAADISRVLPLAFLSPTITKAILTGRQPSALTAREFARATEFPLLWSAQARAFGR